MPDSQKNPRSVSRRAVRALLGVALAGLATAVLPASAAAIHNQTIESAHAINQPGTVLQGSFSHSDTNLADNFYNGGEPTQCVFGDPPTTTYYGSSVWYKFFPHRNGRLRVSVQRTSGNLEPVVGVNIGSTTSDFQGGVCNGSTPPINRAVLPAEGFLQAPGFPISAGQGYLIQVGGATVNNQPPFEETEDPANFDPATEGNFDLVMTYDPDTDGDGLFDSEDDCDGQAGPANFRGCPDSDSDGIADPGDRCPNQHAGSAGSTHGGCPDADRDNVPENGSDKCPGLNPNRINRNDRRPRDGCPDILNNPATIDATSSGIANFGLRFTKFVLKKVPNGSRVVVKCKRPGGGRCGGLRLRRASAAAGAPVRGKAAVRTLPVRSLVGKRLPFGTTITVRITARYATGKFFRWRVLNPPGLSKKEFCTKPGSKRLRRRGCV